MLLLESVFFVIALFLKNSHAKFTCDIETYVLGGLEFSKCHQDSMTEFAENPINVNPCPALKHLVYTCSEVLKSCYDERDWIRSRQAFLELLSLTYPDQNECDLFDARKSDVPQKLPGEKCSINEEVQLLQNMQTCSQNKQTDVLQTLISHRPVPQSATERKRLISDIVCSGLANVSQECFVDNLQVCYDKEDSKYHHAFLLEELRLTGLMMMSHLSSVTSDENSDVKDIEECPVFLNGPLAEYVSRKSSRTSSDSSAVIALAIVLSIVILLLFVGAGYYVTIRARLTPRLQARFENTPYADFNGTAQTQVEISTFQGQELPSSNTGVPDSKVSSIAMTLSSENSLQTPDAGPST